MNDRTRSLVAEDLSLAEALARIVELEYLVSRYQQAGLDPDHPRKGGLSGRITAQADLPTYHAQPKSYLGGAHYTPKALEMLQAKGGASVEMPLVHAFMGTATGKNNPIYENMKRGQELSRLWGIFTQVSDAFGLDYGQRCGLLGIPALYDARMMGYMGLVAASDVRSQPKKLHMPEPTSFDALTRTHVFERLADVEVMSKAMATVNQANGHKVDWVSWSQQPSESPHLMRDLTMEEIAVAGSASLQSARTGWQLSRTAVVAPDMAAQLTPEPVALLTSGKPTDFANVLKAVEDLASVAAAKLAAEPAPSRNPFAPLMLKLQRRFG